jgi:hypothetical protein
MDKQRSLCCRRQVQHLHAMRTLLRVSAILSCLIWSNFTKGDEPKPDAPSTKYVDCTKGVFIEATTEIIQFAPSISLDLGDLVKRFEKGEKVWLDREETGKEFLDRFADPFEIAAQDDPTFTVYSVVKITLGNEATYWVQVVSGNSAGKDFDSANSAFLPNQLNKHYESLSPEGQKEFKKLFEEGCIRFTDTPFDPWVLKEKDGKLYLTDEYKDLPLFQFGRSECFHELLSQDFDDDGKDDRLIALEKDAVEFVSGKEVRRVEFKKMSATAKGSVEFLKSRLISKPKPEGSTAPTDPFEPKESESD